MTSVTVSEGGDPAPCNAVFLLRSKISLSLFKYGGDTFPILMTSPSFGQYLTHAHSHITRAVAAMDSCFALIGAHKQGMSIAATALNHCPDDVAVRMREVVAMPWVAICVPLALSKIKFVS